MAFFFLKLPLAESGTYSKQTNISRETFWKSVEPVLEANSFIYKKTGAFFIYFIE